MTAELARQQLDRTVEVMATVRRPWLESAADADDLREEANVYAAAQWWRPAHPIWRVE